LKTLPISVQDFPTIVGSDCIYVDKTELIYRLLKKGICYFLSRPPGFGKSLLVSTLASLFCGKRELFDDLWISQSDYSWEPYPVLQLDFSRLEVRSPELLVTSLNEYMARLATSYRIALTPSARPAATFARLVTALRPLGSVVVLIDEYDYPILQRLTEPVVAEANRQELLSLFSTLKSLQEDLRFILITGVNRFSTASLYSGMNNLRDISFDPSFAALIGFTENEIRSYLSEYLRAFAHQQQSEPEPIFNALRRWYGGYRFAPGPNTEPLFNPASILHCLDKRHFSGYCYQSGTPSFAVKLMKERRFPVPGLESDIRVGEAIRRYHDLEGIDLAALLLQAGYLTIERYNEDAREYHLRVPNEEVRRSLLAN
jgi:hypothetical protein